MQSIPKCRDYERRLISEALVMFKGVQLHAAQHLGISARVLHYKLQHWHDDDDAYQRSWDDLPLAFVVQQQTDSRILRVGAVWTPAERAAAARSPLTWAIVADESTARAIVREVNTALHAHLMRGPSPAWVAYRQDVAALAT